MKLYICYGSWKPAPRPGGHPCGNAYHVLKEAGYEPVVIRTYGLGVLPDALNITPGRSEVKRLTGNTRVPVLVTDEGTVIQDSHRIMAWARKNPAGRQAAATQAASGSDREIEDAVAEEPPTAVGWRWPRR